MESWQLKAKHHGRDSPLSTGLTLHFGPRMGARCNGAQKEPCDGPPGEYILATPTTTLDQAPSGLSFITKVKIPLSIIGQLELSCSTEPGALINSAQREHSLPDMLPSPRAPAQWAYRFCLSTIQLLL